MSDQRNVAMATLQSALLNAGAGIYVDQLLADMAHVPPERFDDELRAIARLIVAMIERSAPQMSEALRYALPWAFINLVSARRLVTTCRPSLGGYGGFGPRRTTLN